MEELLAWVAEQQRTSNRAFDSSFERLHSVEFAETFAFVFVLSSCRDDYFHSFDSYV